MSIPLHTMKKFIQAALLGMILCAYTAHAQINWHKGEVSLVTGFRLTGELSYQYKTNTLLFRQANKWRTYQIEQLLRFRYTDPVTNEFHTFAPYEITRATGEGQFILFEELLPGVDVQLLELPPQYGMQHELRRWLPYTRRAHWQTPNTRFVWLHGRLLDPDAFVSDELNNLVATTPRAVQRWAAEHPHPADPKSLGRWLSSFHNRMAQATAQSEVVSNTLVVTQSKP